MTTIDMFDASRKAVEKAIETGAEQAEAFATQGRLVTIEMEKNSIKQARDIMDCGIGIRIFINGACGFSCAANIDNDIMTKVIKNAVAQGKKGSPDPNFRTLPYPKSPSPVVGIYDPSIRDIEVSYIVDLISRVYDAAQISDHIYSVNASINIGWEKIAISNSLGVCLEDQRTMITLTCESLARKGEEVSSGYEVQQCRSLREVNVENTARKASEYALRGLKTAEIGTQSLPIVIDPLAACYILITGIGRAVSAEMIQRRRSYLAGKLSQKIASEAFTIYDDGTVPCGIGSASYDGEGTPTKRTTIIDRGILSNYLYDSYAAGKEDKESTGNAYRISYRQVPHIYPTNLIVKPGHGDVNDLISEVKKGIYLRLTFDEPNIATGEFSGLVLEGFMIERGEIAYSVRQTMIGISMLDFLNGIEAIGNDARRLFRASSPSIRVREAMIGGKKRFH